MNYWLSLQHRPATAPGRINTGRRGPRLLHGGPPRPQIRILRWWPEGRISLRQTGARTGAQVLSPGGRVLRTASTIWPIVRGRFSRAARRGRNDSHPA